MDLESAAFESKDENSRKLLKGVQELHTYVERNQNFIPNYGKRYRNGEKIASGFVESAVNQVVSKRMVKRQQMQWTQRGAHLLLQIRARWSGATGLKGSARLVGSRRLPRGRLGI